MMLRVTYILVTVISMSVSFIESASGDPFAVTVRIDLASRHQTIEGFGASGCWTAQLTNDWPELSRKRALDLLFTDQGAGLTMWRYNIGAGGGAEIHDPSRRTSSVEASPGVYDLSRDKAALDVVRGGVERGVDRVILFANSLPERMTVSGKVSGGEDGAPNLKDGSELEAAKYLVDITLRVKQELNLSDVRLSPMNEPQWHWGGKGGRRQEGCYMLPDQLAKLSGECARQLQGRDPSILLEGPEGGEWKGTSFSYVEAFMRDPVLMKQFGALAVHSYWSNDDARREFLTKYRAAGLTIPIAQTEWCDMQWQRDAGMDGAFTLFRTMHSDLTLCNVVSWSFWLAMSNVDYRDGLMYIEKDNTVTPAKRLFVMGHFSRFVKPGAQRVDSKVSDSRVLTSSYVTKAGDEIVTVVCNPTDDVFSLGVESGDSRTNPVVDCYTTDESQDLQKSTCPTNAVAVPPRSIVSIVARVNR